MSPAFLKVKTVRYREHVGPGEDFEGGYRTESEIDLWKALDPLLNSASTINIFTPKIKDEIKSALEFAYNSPFPGPSDLLSDVV